MVHGDEDGGSLQELDLLMFGDEEFGGIRPGRVMFPPILESQQTTRHAMIGRVEVVQGESMPWWLPGTLFVPEARHALLAGE